MLVLLLHALTDRANLRSLEISMHLSQLNELASRYFFDMQHEKQVMPCLSVFHWDAPSKIEVLNYAPALCVILQGMKTASIGDQVANLEPGDALIVSHDLPVVSKITKASTREPYRAVVLFLDMQMLHSLHDQVADALEPAASSRSLLVDVADVAWLAPLVKYFELAGSDLDAKVLGPLILREIHYRLLLSPAGAMLRNLLITDSRASHVAKAIRQLRSEFRVPLRVPDLAKVAGMSESSFHKHFKAITGTTPLQYQKDLRLIEAHALLKAQSHAVSEAAYAVGYESPNHFSRDYSKKFGVPPSKGASA
jgi:AraC-like DNA-binding protein